MYEQYQAPAFAGMKGDAGFDRVETFPVGADTPFGVVAGTNAQGLLVPGAGTKVRGITLHSHALTAGVYKQHDAASVMTRGLVWARVTTAGDVTVDGPVSFAADGTVSDDGATALNNAVFRSEPVAVDGVEIVLVELHNPFSETDTIDDGGGD